MEARKCKKKEKKTANNMETTVLNDIKHLNMKGEDLERRAVVQCSFTLKFA